MPMLDPLATFLQRVEAAGNDVEPVSALFRKPDAISDDQRAMAAELTRRGREQGYLEDSAGTDPVRVSVTDDGRRYLADLEL